MRSGAGELLEPQPSRRRHRRGPAVVKIAAIACLSASACWVPKEQGRLMEARITRLEGEAELSSKQMDEQRAAVRERIATVDQKIAEVQKKLDELNATAHRTGADLAVNQDRLVDEVARLRGQLEEEAHHLQQLQNDTEGRFAALKGVGALQEYEAKKKAGQLQRPADKAEFLALAQQQESAGERAVARELYEEFVKKWPSDPRAADAYFRLGELWFGDKRYREAILAYGKVAQDFPRSDKAPDALFRTGESMIALNLRADAKHLFEEVQKRYPGTTAARRARSMVAELSKKGR